MGFEINRFLNKDSIIDCLICTICTDVIEDPVETPCNHIFCRQCITQWFQDGKNSCPVDRHLLTATGLKTPNRITIQLLNNLVIRCNNFSEGCSLMSKLENISNLVKHENAGCNFAPMNRLSDAQKEIKTLKKKIKELEKNLNFILDKSVNSISMQDHDKELERMKKMQKKERDEKKAKIVEAENTAKEMQEMAYQISLKAFSVVSTMNAARETSILMHTFAPPPSPDFGVERESGIVHNLFDLYTLVSFRYQNIFSGNTNNNIISTQC